jgi:nitrate reductase / nitrite oxidoreductase, alpha subunit
VAKAYFQRATLDPSLPLRFLRRVEPQPRAWQSTSDRSRSWESLYRDRWAHDRVVRSTHGVNCTGSCSWKIYVKDGIVAWETQQTDYPENSCDEPDYEPRGCPRGASFSWYVYSPLRVRYPYVRGVLLERWLEARTRLEPLDAWAEICADPAWRDERGKGGFVRATWNEVAELVAAGLGSTIERYGPDRIAGFSPIPAMSMASFTAGSRFFALLGAPMLSFYDWYCDLPPASPQVFGDQTDVPESADWFNAGYLIMWGSNVPMTRTPDAHFMTEARYRGQKTAVVSPDYSQHTKFADTWLPAQAGTDGALAMAMGHVILREFWVDRRVPYFEDYTRRYTDLPFLVTLEDGKPARFLQASDLGSDETNAEWKPVVFVDGRPVVPNGTVGHRWDGSGRWNLELPGEPALTFLGDEDEVVLVDGKGVPAKQVAGWLVTTVLDLLLAQYGVGRDGLPGDWPASFDDDTRPYTPAWQEQITGVDRRDCTRVARELAGNAEATGGRSMILLGAGVNHWYHGDTAYRAILTLLLLTGCQGVNGGGWAHYVGQEKCRPVTGLSALAGATDWARPPRQQPATPYWYLATEQYRYDELDFDGASAFELHAQAVRLGWLPSYPQFDRSPLDLTPEDTLASLQDGTLGFACEHPSDPDNWPRALVLWRANLLGASSKGHEYFLEHLLGTGGAAENVDPDAPHGKLDLLVTLDFRMSGSALYSDVVLPAATWYEKEDISSTDMHPFVHPFSAAVAPPWEARSDWDTFCTLADAFDRVAGERLGVRADLVAAPLLHDTPDELAQREVKDWRAGECEAIPGKTMPKLVVVERDYRAIGERMRTVGPLLAEKGVGAKGISWTGDDVQAGSRIDTAREVCDAILALSGTTNGEVALKGWRALEKQVGLPLADLGEHDAHVKWRYDDLVEMPRRVITSPEWSGLESDGRRYSPFTANVERLIPWRTLTGRQQLYQDHEWMRAAGEGLPIWKPPLEPKDVGDGVTVRYLTPHNKWSVHSTYGDVETLLTLFRGGQTAWISPEDAAKIGASDNDWVEVGNRNGLMVGRAVVSHRIPEGTVFVYHAQDRHVNVPLAPGGKRRAGGHNSPTRIHLKPTHMIGGSAQLAYGFNYYGPIGAQRDERVTLRRLEEVSW